MLPTHAVPPQEAPETLLQFPCLFPIKVLGQAHPELLAEVERCIAQHVVDQDAVRLTFRESSAGRYVGITITLMAENQAQLDALYQSLGQSPRVHMVL
jgi:putative lipoic acid-binding regulatory protein